MDSTNITIEHFHFYGCPPKRDNIRIVPTVVISDQESFAEPTPQFQGSPPPFALELIHVKIDIYQQCTIKPKALDRKGNPAPVENAEFLVDNPSVLALTPQPDGSCLVRSTGALGNAKVTWSADGDLGDGESVLVGFHDFEVEAAQATTVELEVSPPEDIPDEV